MDATERRRPSSTLILLVVAFVAIFLAGPALYVSTVIDDEDAFVALSDDVVAHPEIRRAVAEVVVAVTVDAVTTEEAVTEALPEPIRPLTVPITSLATAQLTDAAFRLLDTDIASEARQSALREVHRQLTADEDEIVIDLRAVLVRTSRELAGPAVGAGVAKLVVAEDTGRVTLVEADSANADLVALVRAIPVIGAVLAIVGLVALVAAVVVADDRRRALVAAGLTLAAATLASTVVVGVALFAVLAVLTGGSEVGAAVAEVITDDVAEQQRGAFLFGLVVAGAGVALGRSRAAVALRALPADLWFRRPQAGARIGALLADNPPLSRLLVWLAGAATLQGWTAPTWRVVLTTAALVAIGQGLVWAAASPGPSADRWRSRLHLGAPPTGVGLGPSRLAGNVAVLTAGTFLLWPGWNRSLLIAFAVAGWLVQAVVEVPAARRRVLALRAERASAPPEGEAADGIATGDDRDPVGVSRPGRLAVAAGVIGLALVATAFSTMSSAERAEDDLGCNGHEELCDRRIDEVVFAGSHNAMSSSDLGWDLALQTGDMVTQLDHGVRALLIDALYWGPNGQLDGGEAAAAAQPVIEAALGTDRPRAGTWLCHGFCALGATDLVAGLAEIDLWLAANPREVLLIVVQDEVTAEDLEAAFDDSGLRRRIHAHRPGDPFPTLGELIERDERVLVYGENQGQPGAWFQNAYATTFTETPFTFAVRSDFSCEPNRGREANPLFLINHWLTTGIPVREAAITINSRDILLERVTDCERERGRLPTVLAVDFVETGDLIEVVDELNGVDVDGS